MRGTENYMKFSNAMTFRRTSTHTSISHIFIPVIAIGDVMARSGKLVQHRGLVASLTSFCTVAATLTLVHKIIVRRLCSPLVLVARVWMVWLFIDRNGNPAVYVLASFCCLPIVAILTYAMLEVMRYVESS